MHTVLLNSVQERKNITKYLHSPISEDIAQLEGEMIIQKIREAQEEVHIKVTESK